MHLEAMACGLPVITTKQCGSVIEDKKEGFIIPLRNPLAMANAIINIVENRALRNKMSRAAKIKAKKYTWSQYSENLLKVLESNVS